MNPTSDTCTATRRDLSARRDGLEIDAADLAAHLTTCADCRAWQARLDGLGDAWTALAEVPLPGSLWPRIAARTRPEPRSWRVLQRAAALVLGLVSVGVLALQRGSRPVPHDPSRLLRVLLEPPARTPAEPSTEHRLLTPFEEGPR